MDTWYYQKNTEHPAHALLQWVDSGDNPKHHNQRVSVVTRLTFIIAVFATNFEAGVKRH